MEVRPPLHTLHAKLFDKSYILVLHHRTAIENWTFMLVKDRKAWFPDFAIQFQNTSKEKEWNAEKLQQGHLPPRQDQFNVENSWKERTTAAKTLTVQ